MIFSSLDKAGDNGWYIGDFESAVFKSKDIEVCYQTIEKGYTYPHYHTKCTEILLVTKGKAILNEKKIKKGDIVVINKGEVNDLLAISKKFTVVGVKIPAGGNDKVRI
jgi:uncharacterized protein YjlB